MFTESFKVGCNFPACQSGSAKCQKCFTDPPRFCIQTVALATWKLFCSGTLQLVGYTSCHVKSGGNTLARGVSCRNRAQDTEK